VEIEKWPAINIGKAYNGMKFMMEAIKKAGTTDVPAVIKTWEGMKWESIIGPMVMRAEDHQVMMPFRWGRLSSQQRILPLPLHGRTLPGAY